ncbi:hypothetical protein PROFUN_09206 [Planoprotostelium fungivorum]|uniref:Uncharacterized protein n=1 Tax=Planoprotostelium fungivorum TaxID=1890364 RepID=A0A2P6NHJ6_9EUKA|nr:hypothetical protein PROFUN_09206 [Planoprotostelium fungivorum]
MNRSFIALSHTSCVQFVGSGDLRSQIIDETYTRLSISLIKSSEFTIELLICNEEETSRIRTWGATPGTGKSFSAQHTKQQANNSLKATMTMGNVRAYNLFAISPGTSHEPISLSAPPRDQIFNGIFHHTGSTPRDVHKYEREKTRTCPQPPPTTLSNDNRQPNDDVRPVLPSGRKLYVLGSTAQKMIHESECLTRLWCTEYGRTQPG